MFILENIVVKDVLTIDLLHIKEKVMSIEGQSGSGKSTILRLLNNLDDPAKGQIYFKNKNIQEISPMDLRKRVVMLPQHPVIFNGTIEDNLTIGLHFSNQPQATKQELQKVLDDLWIDKPLTTSASDLSGGEKQRLAIGRMLLMKETEVFLLDEPSSDLDDHTTNHVIAHFRRVASEHGQQMIMVTHDTDLSKQFADEVIHMDKYSMQKQVK